MPVIWQSLTASHLTITPEGYSRTISKILTAKSISELLGQRSGTAWSGRTGEHPHRAFLSRQQSLLAASPQPARFYYHSCDTDSVRESKRFGPKARPSLRSIFRSTPSLCVKIRHRNKSAYSGHCFSLNCWEYWREKKDQPRDISILYPPGYRMEIPTECCIPQHSVGIVPNSLDTPTLIIEAQVHMLLSKIDGIWIVISRKTVPMFCVLDLHFRSNIEVRQDTPIIPQYLTENLWWGRIIELDIDWSFFAHSLLSTHRAGHQPQTWEVRNWKLGQILEIEVWMSTFFAQYTSSRSSTSNVRSEKLKIRTDPGDWVMDGWSQWSLVSNTVDDYFQ